MEKLTVLPLASQSDRRQWAANWLSHAYEATLVCLMLLPLVALTVLPVSLSAQTSQAVVRGGVSDISGAVVPAATLTLRNIETGIAIKTISNDVGNYLFPGVNPGTYTLQASANGFTSRKLQPFVLQVNQETTLDFKLSPGQVTQVVHVQAQGEAIETASTELGLTLGSKQIEELPVDSRNFTALILTAPGVSPISVPGSQTLQNTTSIGPAIIPSFNGQTQRSNVFVVDGILDDETFGNGYAVQPILNSIQNMKLQSHNDSAQFGGSTGGTVNMATKAGTNQFHGNLWEYFKPSSLQAINYFSTRVTRLTQNQFGGGVGGPVLIPHLYNGHDKTFFYFAYEGYRFSSPDTDYLLVPTAAQLSGDFSGYAPIYDPASTTCDASGVCARKQFSYNGMLNHIDPSRINAGAVYFAQHTLPAPTNPTFDLPGGANAFQDSSDSSGLNSYDFRIDQSIGANSSAFFRMMRLTGTTNSGRTQLRNAQTTDAYSWVGSFTHSFNPSTILHLAFGRTYERRDNEEQFVGLPSGFNSKVGFPSGLTSGYSTLGSSVIPELDVDNYFASGGTNGNPIVSANDWEVTGDLTKVIGRHTFHTGAGYNSVGESQAIEAASEEFRAQETNSLVDGTSGDAMASFVIGNPGSFQKRNVVETIGWGGMFSAYLQDTIRVTNTLTVNAGLRYDLFFLPAYGTSKAGNQYVGNFDFNNGTYEVLKLPKPCAVTGTAPCIPTPGGILPDHVVLSPTGTKVMQNQYNNLQPRFGIAYRIWPNTALRGGIGLTFDNYAGVVQNVRGLSGNWPSVGQVAKSNINAPTAADPFPGYTLQNLPALTSLPDPTPFNQFNWFIDPKVKNAYSIQFNFGVQHQISPSTVVSATYVGSVNRRLDVGGYYNVAKTLGPGDPTLRQPYPYISPTFYSWSGGSGNYNALQLQLTRRFTKGFAATVAYTWGKSMDKGCSGFFGSEGCDIQQIYNLNAEYSVSAFDVTNLLVLTENYQLPIGPGQLVNIENRTLNLLVGGWQVNSISSLHSGSPYDLTIPQDIANIGNTGYERPNVVGDPTPRNRTVDHWLNPSAFAVPNLYTYGNLGRNSLRTQFFQDYDLSVFKTVPLNDRLHLRVSMEAFNFINHPIFGQPNSSFGDPNFGKVSSTASNTRTTQVSAHFIF